MIKNNLPKITRPDLMTEDVSAFVFNWQVKGDEIGRPIFLCVYEGPDHLADHSLDAAQALFYIDDSPSHSIAREQVKYIGFEPVGVLNLRFAEDHVLADAIGKLDTDEYTYLFALL